MSMRTYEKTLKISKRNHLFKSDIPLILNSSINTRTIMLLYTSIASNTRRKEKPYTEHLIAKIWQVSLLLLFVESNFIILYMYLLICTISW